MSGRGRGGRGGRGGRTNERRGQRSMNDIVTKKPKYHRYQNADVLLTDEIYPNGAPHEAQGKLFQYKVISYDSGNNADDAGAKYTLRYEGKMIDPQGCNFVSYAAASAGALREEMGEVNYDSVKAGAKRFNCAITRINNKRIEDENKVKAEIDAVKPKGSGSVDTSDIEKIFNEDEKGVKSNKVMELEFELTGNVGENKREWRHKRCIGRTFWQYKNKGKDTYDTGVWTKNLEWIAQNKKHVNGDGVAIERAKFILKLRLDHGEEALSKVCLSNNFCVGPKVLTSYHTQGKGFYPFEEDVDHHIREAFVIISSGLGTGFFQNPHVIELLRGLNKRHRPLYHRKMLRLLRVVVYTLNEEISLIIREAYLIYNSGFVSSMSDFWWHPGKKMSFGACIACVMAHRYPFKNGLSLFVSQATYGLIKGDTSILKSSDPVPKYCRAQMLLDFVAFDEKKNAENIGAWLTDCHAAVKCKPSYISSHIVDGASDAGASVQVMKVNMAGETPREMQTDKCDSHQANTSGRRASGTSAHSLNLNPELGTSLVKLHNTVGRIIRSGVRKDVLNNVRNEKNRQKWPELKTVVATRWNSEQLETETVSANQLDLKVAVTRMVSPDGEDKELYVANRSRLEKVVPTNHDYTLYGQVSFP